MTVPEVLAAEARTLLERDGYTLVAPELVDAATEGRAPASATDAAATAAAHDLPGAVLYIEVRQWAADITYGPSSIIVAMHIDLVEPSTGKRLWSADRPQRPVRTQGTINFADAYWVAARAVIGRDAGAIRRGAAPAR